MRFGNPEYFYLLLIIPLLIGLFIWVYQKKRIALNKFAQKELAIKLIPGNNSSRLITKWILFICFFLFSVFSLIRPRFGAKMEMIERKGVDIMIALDISKSMLAQDIAPNRIDRAKHEISKLINLLKGDRIGLIVFAGESYIQCPLTLDYGAANLFLDAVSTGWVDLQGTALADAIDQSTKAFRSKERKHKVLIILSDGEDHQGNTIEAAKRAAQEGVILYTVGIGSENGVPIPISQSSGNVVYKKDNQGNLVMTRLNPVILEKIALESKGKYFDAGTNLDLTRIYSEIAAMEKKELGSQNFTSYEERFQIPLFIALFFIIFEFFIPERIRRRKEWKGRFE